MRGSFLSWLRAFVRNVFRGRAADADLRDDVDAYVELLIDEKIASGLPPAEARRMARLEIGGADVVKEQTREVRAGARLAQVVQDARYALRLLRRDWIFTSVAVMTLALGIGANTAIFSLVHTVLLTPLPYVDPDRLVLIWERNASTGRDRDPVAPLNYRDWSQQHTAFESLGAYRVRSVALSGVDRPQQVAALAMSSTVFRVLGVSAFAGRTFTEAEERRQDRSVVLSHGFWQRQFSGDPTLVGRTITLSGDAFTVVGVMPPRFAFPDGNPVDAYIPLRFTQADLNGRRLHTLTVIGRLARSATLHGASADMGRIARSIAAADPGSNPDVTVVGAHRVLVEDIRAGLIVLFVTVGFVLLIACGNIANLLLVRAVARQHEMAIRSALGATRARLVGQLLTESVLLAVLGGVAGLLVATGLLRMLTEMRPPDLTQLRDVRIEPAVLAFVAAVTLTTGVVFGIVPAWRVSRAGQRSTTMWWKSGGRAALLATELALSLMLLAGAGLMIRTLVNAQALDLGFRAGGVLTANLFLPPSKYPVERSRTDDSNVSVFFGELEDRLRTVPGVESVGAVSSLPLNPVGVDFDLPVVVEGRPRARLGEEPQADFRVATPGYFRTMGIPLLAGREFTAFDRANAAAVAIINDTLATQIFSGENPLGRRLMLYGQPRQIVGVVGSVRHRGFSRDARPEMILPHRQFPFGSMTVVVRGPSDAGALAASLERSVHALDPDQPVSDIRTLDALQSDSIAQPRFTALLLVAFAGLALTLAIVGVYGVMSYSVSQRSREIAVRMALGAHRGAVVWMTVRQGMALAAVGIAIGLLGAVAGTQLMRGLLFGVSPTDPLTFAAASASLGLASLGACYIPARRAARVAPAAILKSE